MNISPKFTNLDGFALV